MSQPSPQPDSAYRWWGRLGGWVENIDFLFYVFKWYFRHILEPSQPDFIQRWLQWVVACSQRGKKMLDFKILHQNTVEKCSNISLSCAIAQKFGQIRAPHLLEWWRGPRLTWEKLWFAWRMLAISFRDHFVSFEGKNRTKRTNQQKSAKSTFHPTDMLHHWKCSIFHTDSENEQSDPLVLLQIKRIPPKKLSFVTPIFPNLPHGILECAAA